MPSEVYLLIGLPGSGKSTFRSRLLRQYPEAAIISTDDEIEAYAASEGLTYTEAFPRVDMKHIEMRALLRFGELLEPGRVVIVDRTNLRFRSREKFLRLVPSYYDTLGVIFPIPEELHETRLLSRAEATGKHIPWHVIETMRDAYEPPRTDEFTTVLSVNPWTGEPTAMEDIL